MKQIILLLFVTTQLVSFSQDCSNFEEFPRGYQLNVAQRAIDCHNPVVVLDKFGVYRFSVPKTWSKKHLVTGDSLNTEGGCWFISAEHSRSRNSWIPLYYGDVLSFSVKNPLDFVRITVHYVNFDRKVGGKMGYYKYIDTKRIEPDEPFVVRNIRNYKTQ